MKKIKYSLIISCILATFVCHGAVIKRSDRYLYSGLNEVNYKGPADQEQYQSMIANSGPTEVNLCNSNEVDYDLGRIMFIPKATFSGLSFTPGASFGDYFLFESTVASYKIVPWYSTQQFNGANMPGSQVNRGFYKEATDAWIGSPFMSNAKRKAAAGTSQGGIKVTFGYFIYKGPNRVPAGNYMLSPLPSNELGEFQCFDSQGELRETQSIFMTPISSRQEVTGCVPDVKNDVVEMGTISVTALSAGDVGAGTLKSFSLTCDPDVSVNLSLVDLANQGNVTTISTLSSGSTATGVGYSVLHNGHTLRFGPDISSAGTGDLVDRVKVGSSTSAGLPVRFSLVFKFAPTGEQITKGTASSLIGLTYSYQ